MTTGGIEVSPAGTRTVWQIDPGHTLAEFSSRYMKIITVKGRFNGVSGTIVADEEDPSHSTVEVEIDARKIDTGEEKRDQHLSSPDFLDVENHPTITFKSTRAEPVTTDRLRLTGDLTIRGTTRPVELDATLRGRANNPWGQQVAGFSAKTTINRHDFGLNWNVAIEDGFLVSDTVDILLEVLAVKQP